MTYEEIYEAVDNAYETSINTWKRAGKTDREAVARGKAVVFGMVKAFKLAGMLTEEQAIDIYDEY